MKFLVLILFVSYGTINKIFSNGKSLHNVIQLRKAIFMLDRLTSQIGGVSDTPIPCKFK
jgi:hypothetical protein